MDLNERCTVPGNFIDYSHSQGVKKMEKEPPLDHLDMTTWSWYLARCEEMGQCLS